MRNFKEKYQLFIMGLMAGLLIAGGFFILKLDDYFKELNLYKNVIKTFSYTSKNDDTLKNSGDTLPSEEKQESGNKIKNKKNIANEISTKKDLVLNTDTINSHSIKDSLLISGVINPDDIVIRKDELLFTKTIEVLNLNPVTNRTSKDSLLQKVSGVSEEKNNTKEFFNIEFWQSPLNYKGYRMSKYKLVLYGVTSADKLKIYKLDDVIYLKNGALFYQLDYASDFKQYERITDEVIINRLK
jgi:hypothetical protein